METTRILVAKDIQEKMQTLKDVVLIDTLSAESFLAKRIPGSINLPSDKIKEHVELILPDKNQLLIPYCANSACMKSVHAAQILTELGYTRVAHYPDGLSGWLQEGYTLVGTGTPVTDDCT